MQTIVGRIRGILGGKSIYIIILMSLPVKSTFLSVIFADGI